MIEVGDIVKYVPVIFEDAEWLGLVVEKGHNGHNPWLKVRFFEDEKERVFSDSKFVKVS
jgi:hypothetical protein